MYRSVVSALLALGLVGRADAHRLDEYLQATLIGVTPATIDIEIQLTPGVAILPVWMSVIDKDRDGSISPEEQRVYIDRVMREVDLRIDGVPAPLSLVESNFPTLDAMRDGLGAIVIKLRATRRGHELRFENRHLPQVSAYLVNCLTDLADGLAVGRQQRDEAQRSIEFQYSFETGRQTAWATLTPFWPALIGMPLAVRMAMLIFRSRNKS